MANIYDQTYFKDGLKPLSEARLSVASSAILYGLSVYTVFPVHIAEDGRKLGFRVADHYKRLVNSSRIIGIDTFEKEWSDEKFYDATQKTIEANDIKVDLARNRSTAQNKCLATNPRLFDSFKSQSERRVHQLRSCQARRYRQWL
jgi:branched-subunit amino acid aminotransferase/4-amino-4-deoxychorismate lyase